MKRVQNCSLWNKVNKILEKEHMLIIFWLKKLFMEVYLILEMPNKERRKRVKDTELKIAAKNCSSITSYVRWAV